MIDVHCRSPVDKFSRWIWEEICRCRFKLKRMAELPRRLAVFYDESRPAWLRTQPAAHLELWPCGSKVWMATTAWPPRIAAVLYALG